MRTGKARHKLRQRRTARRVRKRAVRRAGAPSLAAATAPRAGARRTADDETRKLAARLESGGSGVPGAHAGVSDIHAAEVAAKRYRVALLHSPAIVFTQDRALRYTWIHHPAKPWRELDLLGKTDAELLPEADARRLTAIKRRVLRTGEGSRELVEIAGTAGRRWYDLTVEPLVESNGRIVGITCATWDVTDQRKAQEEARRVAVLEERNRLAREMHDSLAQGLVAVVLRLEAAEEEVTRDPTRGVAVVRSARDMVRHVLDEARRSLLALRPRLLDEADLATAVDMLAGSLRAQTKASLRVSVRGRQRPLAREIEENLLRVAQEALQNAVRHSAATRITTELAFEPRSIRLRIEDDGRGFDPDGPRPGMGLGIMRERVERIGGVLSIDSSPGGGTRVEARIKTALQPEKGA